MLEGFHAGISSIFGRSRVSYHYSDNKKPIVLKDGTAHSLPDLCKAITPSCWLNPFLFNGHLQTMWTAVISDGPPMIYKRKIFEAKGTEYTGSFTVDFVVHYSSKLDESLPPQTTYYTKKELQHVASHDEKPMIVCLAGLSGGSYEGYLRHVLGPLTEDEAWEACVVNSRGCAESQISTGVLYNAKATWDLRQTIEWLRKKFPNRPLFGLGFSIGANILTNYLGEEGTKCVLQAAVLCANPWNLEVSNVMLHKTWLGREIYSKVMASSMKSLVERHIEQIEKRIGIQIEEIRRIKHLFEFDRIVQCPTWGYPTEGEYYRDASSVRSLLAVKVPCLAINAEDDPIACKEAIPYHEVKQNPYVVLCTTSTGGHMGWFQLGGARWHSEAIIAFLKEFSSRVELRS